MILAGLLGFQAADNIPETFAIRELAEAPDQSMIIFGQAFGWPGRGKEPDASRKFRIKKSGSDLREDGTLVWHRGSFPMRGKQKYF